jgi:hypothetical protein
MEAPSVVVEAFMAAFFLARAMSSGGKMNLNQSVTRRNCFEGQNLI